jgi:hypothetical protein
VANTSNDGPLGGAVVHWKAHPIFQPGAVVVKVGLVQLPVSCVGPRSRRAGVDVVDVLDVEDDDVCFVVDNVEDEEVEEVEVFPVVGVVEAPVVLFPATVVLVALDPDGGGRTYPLEPLEPDDGLAPTVW